MLRHFLELIRFSHTLFALPFAMVSAILAWRTEPFRWLDLLGVLLCMVFARSSAMGFNRLADRRYDALNPRTAARHLPAGKLSVATVSFFVIVCTAGFLTSAFLFVLSNQNWLPLYLALPVLIFICSYSFTKRFTALSHYWLGASLMMAPIAAWIAIQGNVAWPPVVLGLAVLCWVGGFDILYACQDVDFDLRAGLHSVPVRLGVTNSLRMAASSHAVMISLLVLLWWVAGLGTVYLTGVIAAAALIAYEHWLVRPDDLSRVNLAFFHVNSIVSVGLLLAVSLDLWIIKAD